jgi:secreted trypsin-like serine protease
MGLVAGGSAGAVAPGVSTKRNEFRATGALVVFAAGAPQLLCTATLIAPDVLISAAHCLRPLGHRRVAFVLDERLSDATPETAHPVAQIRLHPGFAVSIGAGAPLHDLALVRLEAPVRNVPPETLLSVVEASALTPGEAIDLVGYGRASRADDRRGIKNRGRSRLGEVRSFEWVIGGGAGVQNCDGDSGGPAFVEIRGKRRLMGIVSRSVDPQRPCESGTVHSRPDADAGWIAATLAGWRR